MSVETRMRALLPDYYRKSDVMQNNMRASANEVERRSGTIARVRFELSPSNASTELDRWEKDYNLYPGPDADKEERRRAVLTAVRAGGTVTVDTVRMLAETYFERECAVTENYADYSIIVTALNGVPEEAIRTFTAVARKLIPAHLGITVRMDYNTWGDASAYTWETLSKYTWDEIWKNKGGIT